MDDADPQSGIGAMLVKHQQLTSTLLHKIQTAKATVHEITAQQQQWISSSLAVALNEVKVEAKGPARKAIWSSFKCG